MRQNLLLFFIFLFVLTYDYSFSQSRGEALFTKTCQVCHTIGKGRLVGPDLMDIENRRTEDWIINFVKSSQNMVKNNDQDAVKLFNEYNKLVMPDQYLSDGEIKEVLVFIREQPLSDDFLQEISVQNTNSLGMSLDHVSIHEITIGQNLFQGKITFKEGGPACIACHTVVNDSVFSGGLLGIDLTTVFTRMKGPGIDAILSDPPFPVMKAAYNNHPIAKDEVFYLTAFLKEADFISPVQEPNRIQQLFLFESVIGSIVLFGLYGRIWRKRRRKPINNKILNKLIQ